jgi:alpha-tubulin suppressor-like RCC1 family protein
VFITRQGAELRLNGDPYRFTGINIYNANSDGTCGPAFGAGPELDEALSLIGSGAMVMRAWFFQSMATVDGQRDWSAFDHTLSTAAGRGVLVIPTLANQWPDCEPASGFKAETWYETGYTQPDPSGTVSYRDFVAEVVDRYKNDPTIAFWQLMNEAEVKPSQNSAVCSADAAGLLESFAADVSGLIKSIDQNHLVSLGTIGSGQCGAQEDEYHQVHSVPTIDLCEFHDYDATATIPGDQFNGLQVRLDQCAQLGKPLFVGEMGMTPEQAGGGLHQRADAFSSKFRAQFGAGSVGEVLWAWYEAAPVSLSSLDIHRSDPLLRVLAGALNPGIRAIGAGGWHNCAITSSDDIKCWGSNFSGNLGDGSMDQRNRPVDVAGYAGATTVSGGTNHTCASAASGSVTCWGQNSSGELGIGIPVTHRATPQESVVGIDDARAVDAGAAHACALREEGVATCWGSSGSGQLGSGFPVGSGVQGPANVVSPEPFQQIVAGNSHTCGVTVDGGAKCWGSSASGQVGDGDQFSTSPRATPVDVVGLTSGVIKVAPGGAHTCALTVGGVKCWGSRHAGQLGDGQINQLSVAHTPVDVIGLPDGIQAVASGAHHTCVITSAGSLLCWGDNDYGQLGNGSNSDSPTPVAVTGMSADVLAVTGGERHTCALRDDGSVWCWGDGANGQLGNGSTAASNVPVEVDFEGGPADSTPPTVTLTTPENGAVYTVGQSVAASYSCEDEPGGSGLQTCQGDVDDGEEIDTSSTGTFTFTVTARDGDLNETIVDHTYIVNDVSGGDADGDGLLNEWETDGIDADADGTIDLHLEAPPYNADPDHKDVFVEIDYMDCSQGGCDAGVTSHAPTAGALGDVEAAFDAAPLANPDGVDGVTLHAMVDEQVPEILLIDFGGVGGNLAYDGDYDELKSGDPDLGCDGAFGTPAERNAAECETLLAARALAFHYAVFGEDYSANHSSGVAEIFGNDLMVTLGGWSATNLTKVGGLRSAEAGTFMHELGHNLGLFHGGFESTNCKPNYLSVMSYPLQFAYADPTRPLDYSQEELAPLDEFDLAEPDGINGPAGRYTIFGVNGQTRVSRADEGVDWNGDGDVVDLNVVSDVNFIDVSSGCSGAQDNDVHASFDDWSNLFYTFQGVPSFVGGVHPVEDDPEVTEDDAVAIAESVDFDGDGTSNADDTCPADANDLDGDGLADSCDPDNRVLIDIKPGSSTNPIQRGAAGSTPVAILSSATFSAPARVMQSSLTFGRTGTETSFVKCDAPQDVNGDGRLDLVCKFDTKKSGFQLGNTVGVLRGRTVAGARFEGTDVVTIKK